jgi:DNA-binding GntR family transcriptional regulator
MVTAPTRIPARKKQARKASEKVAPHTLPEEAGGSDPSSQHSSFEKVYRGILRDLYEGRLVPGQRLVEPDLMNQFHVGRGTIREVLNRLSSAGIVTLVRHRGAAVRIISRKEVIKLLDVVEILFGLAARRTTENILADPSLAKVLNSACDAMLPFESRDDFAGFELARENYYRTVMHLSENYELTRVFPTVQVYIMRIQLRRFDYAADALQFGDYRAITRTILSGDPDKAENIARAHVRHTTDRIKRVPDRAFGQGSAP